MSEVPFKFNEDQLIAEFAEYIKSTYEGHYIGENNVQALDLICATGHAEGFTIGSILKYASRYGKKDGYNRKDIMKILHYALILLYEHDRKRKPTYHISPGITAKEYD